MMNKDYYSKKNFQTAPPSLIKWTGSKRLQAKTIASYFPENTGGTYYEPFLGSGAVLYHAVKFFHRSIASDIYEPLINIWKSVQDNPQDVINAYTNNWIRLQRSFPDYYYEVRSRFNIKHSSNDLFFLSRTCVNGIIRFNNYGEFNNSIHLSRRGMLPSKLKQVVTQWHNSIQSVLFSSNDYSHILKTVKKSDFVYLDPPYANSHNRYIDCLNIERFIDFLYELNSRKVLWALSFDGLRGNSDFTYKLPEDLYEFHIKISNGNSAVQNVLNSSVETVHESLYLNYTPKCHPIDQQALLFCIDDFNI